jgi:hypothetical protein
MLRKEKPQDAQVARCPGVTGAHDEQAEGPIHLAFGSSSSVSQDIFIVCILLCVMISGILAVNKTIRNIQIKLVTLVLFNTCYMFRSIFRTIFRQFH